MRTGTGTRRGEQRRKYILAGSPIALFSAGIKRETANENDSCGTSYKRACTYQVDVGLS